MSTVKIADLRTGRSPGRPGRMPGRRTPYDLTRCSDCTERLDIATTPEASHE